MEKFVPSVMEKIAEMRAERRGIKPKDEKKVKAIRKKRARRGRPVMHLDMTPPDATPDERRAWELRQRAERRDERSHRSRLFQQNAPKVERPKPTETNVSKTKAAAMKRERRRQRNLIQVAREAQGHADAAHDIKNGWTWAEVIPGFDTPVDLDWTKKGAGR